MAKENQGKSVDKKTDPKVQDVGFDDSKFFQELDRAINPALYEQSGDIKMSINTIDNKPAEAVQPKEEESHEEIYEDSDEQGDTEDEYNKLSKAYSESSKEARRLNDKLKEVEPYMPILDAMKNDPALIQHVRSYYDEGGQPSDDMVDELKLGEDFIWDGDEAIRDPKSDSAKVLEKTMDKYFSKKLHDYDRKMRQQSEIYSKEQEFKQKHNLSEDEFADIKKFGESHVVTFDDILYLKEKHSGNRDKNIIKEHTQEKVSQLKKMQNTPKTLAGVGASKEEKLRPEDKIFASIKAAVSGGEIFKPL